jgi:hypothetical protein
MCHDVFSGLFSRRVARCNPADCYPQKFDQIQEIGIMARPKQGSIESVLTQIDKELENEKISPARARLIEAKANLVIQNQAEELRSLKEENANLNASLQAAQAKPKTDPYALLKEYEKQIPRACQ